MPAKHIKTMAVFFPGSTGSKYSQAITVLPPWGNRNAVHGLDEASPGTSSFLHCLSAVSSLSAMQSITQCLNTVK